MFVSPTDPLRQPFILDEPAVENAGIPVRECGHRRFQLKTTQVPTQKSGLETGPDFALHAIVQRRVCWVSAQRGEDAVQILCRPGSFIFTTPGSMFRINQTDAVTLRTLVIPQFAFNAVLSKCAMEAELLERLTSTAYRDPFLKLAFQRLWCETDGSDVIGRDFADCLINTILLRLVVLAESGQKQTTINPLTRGIILRLTRFIDDEIENALPLETLAARARLSPSHFCRAFKAATGQSPRQFVLMRRLDKARALLTDTEDALADIAYACGFSSQAHMTTTFSKIAGETPGRIRKLASA
jgi:AraC family transcriptional regulator